MTDALSFNRNRDKPVDKALSGLSILVTRPVMQAEPLIKRLKLQGASVYHQPTISIEAIHNVQQTQIIKSINQFNCLIFISKNAVEYGLKLINSAQNIAPSQHLAAIGKATRDALIEHGYSNITSPDNGFDSEALLNSPAFDESQIQKEIQ